MNILAQPMLSSQQSLGRRILSHWLVRLFLTFIIYTFLIAIVDGLLFELLGLPDTLFLDTLTGAIEVLGAIAIVTLLVERRPLRTIGLGLEGLLPQWGRGFAVGAAYLTFCVVVVIVAGAYRIEAVNFAVGSLLSGLALQIVIGLFEEGLFRGILFRLLEEGVGSWAALLLSAALFGAMHLGNPEATLWGAAAIAIEAGLLLGAAYMVTRNFWFIAGLHTAWNFMQGPIFGFTISGSDLVKESLFEPLIEGPMWLTGGAFGLEASASAVLGGLVLAIVFAALAVRRGLVMRPLLWRAGFNQPRDDAELVSGTSADAVPAL